MSQQQRNSEKLQGTQATALLRDLIAAQGIGERAVQGVIQARLEQAGCSIQNFDYDPGTVPVRGEFAIEKARAAEHRRAVVGTLPGDPNLPSLLMFAHPDGEPMTGSDRWRHDPLKGEIDQQRIYGWGVADDLAGCAAAVLAIEALATSGKPIGKAVFASTPSKRYARGVAALLHNGLTADAALYLHPAESGVGMREIKAVASGQLEFSISITGMAPDTTEPGHTAFSHLGVNPIDKALLIREALYALAGERAQRIRHPLIESRVGRATNLHISRIRCGEMRRFSRIDETCEMGGAISFPPGETLDQVRTEVEGAIDKAVALDSWLSAHPPELTWVTGVTGAEVPATHPLYQVASASVRSVTGEEPQVNPMHTSSDIRNPMIEADIPCVGLGCLAGDLSQNERHDEWVDLKDFHRMVEVTAKLASDWCGGSRNSQAL